MQAAKTTYGALEELLQYVENNPEIYKRIIAKRRIEEEENAGPLSYLKVKLMVALHGEEYAVESITNTECENEINKFQNNICQVFNYAQDSKQKSTRFSKRLAAKTKKQKSSETTTLKRNVKSSTIPPPLPPALALSGSESVSDENDVENVVIIPKGRPSIHSGTKKQKKGQTVEALMSPPPPPPPPPSAVLQDSTNKRNPGKSTPTSKMPDVLPASDGKLLTNKLKPKSKQFGSTASLASVGSIQDELRSFDRKLLKSVSSVKSPGGTPQPTPRTKRLLSTPVVSPSMHSAFNMKMLDKFKNIRSPPSNHNSPASGFNSTSDFTP